MTTKQIPPPWCIGSGPNGEVEIWGRMSMGHSPIVASMEHDPREMHAVAIVRAVNSYEVMLAALNAAVNWYTPPNDSGPFPLKQIADAIAVAQSRPRAASGTEG